MKCPFLKTYYFSTMAESDEVTLKTANRVEEIFKECLGSDCKAYDKGLCKLMETFEEDIQRICSALVLETPTQFS